MCMFLFLVKLYKASNNNFFRDALMQGLNAQGCGEGAEFIRNIARTIFGEEADIAKGNEQQQQQQPAQEKQPEKDKSADKPMDVDAAAQEKEPIVVDGPNDWNFVQKDKPSSSSAPSAPTPENPTHPNPVIADGLRQLRDMGFSNHAVLTALLEKHEGNLPYVIRDLLNVPK